MVRTVIVGPTSEWKWLHPVDGVNPADADPDFHETFASPNFDDAGWQSGRDKAEPGGGFGYGDDWFNGVDIGTPTFVNAGGMTEGKVAYFRHRFTTSTEHRNLELRCQRDDGIIVYLDGKEVARDNMHAGKEAYLLPATATVGPNMRLKERTTYSFPLKGITLPPGEHTLAISVHNTKSRSSDLRIGGITLVEVETPNSK